MPNVPDPSCPVCLSPLRYSVEQAYLEGSGDMRPFRRQQVERHMSHLADPQALKLVTNLTEATAVASRLRQLEVTAMAILDAALSPPPLIVDGHPVAQQADGKLALAALREVRHTLVEIGKLASTLDSRNTSAEERPDLDDAIAAYVGGRMRNDDHPEQVFDAPRELEAGEQPPTS